MIELHGGVEFKDGLDIWLGRFVVAQQPDSAPAAAAAQAINALPVAERRAAMAPWLWNAAGKTTFLAEFESSIEEAWRSKHQFHCSKEFWTDLGSTVDVRVVVHEGEQGSGDHLKITSYKESDTVVNSGPAYVAPTESFGSHDADDNEMVLTSNQTRRRSDIAQSVGISFRPETTDARHGVDQPAQLVRQRLQERRRPALQHSARRRSPRPPPARSTSRSTAAPARTPRTPRGRASRPSRRSW